MSGAERSGPDGRRPCSVLLCEVAALRIAGAETLNVLESSCPSTLKRLGPVASVLFYIR